MEQILIQVIIGPNSLNLLVHLEISKDQTDLNYAFQIKEELKF